MTRRLFVWVLTFTGLLAWPALATPDRITQSDDRLMAATQTHIYVLRDIVDNLGSYYTKLHDQHLVEISIETGEATRFWPLRQMKVSHLDESDDRIPGHVVERAGKTHDMIDILRGLGAEPMTPRDWLLDDLTLTDGALMRAGDVVITPFAIRATARAQLAILREAYPPIETEEEYFSGETLDFYDLYAEGDWTCEMQPRAILLRRAEAVLRVAKLECETAGWGSFVSFHIFAHDTP